MQNLFIPTAADWGKTCGYLLHTIHGRTRHYPDLTFLGSFVDTGCGGKVKGSFIAQLKPGSSTNILYLTISNSKFINCFVFEHSAGPNQNT